MVFDVTVPLEKGVDGLLQFLGERVGCGRGSKGRMQSLEGFTHGAGRVSVFHMVQPAIGLGSGAGRKLQLTLLRPSLFVTGSQLEMDPVVIGTTASQPQKFRRERQSWADSEHWVRSSCALVDKQAGSGIGGTKAPKIAPE